MAIESDIAGFLTAIVTLLLAAHLLGCVFQRLRLPRVVGEIVAGLILGPSVFGILLPDLMAFLIPSSNAVSHMLSSFHWLGLTLLMFVAGFRFQRRFEKNDKTIIIVLLSSATLIPFAAGWMLTVVYDFSPYQGPSGNSITMALILAIAVAVTSIPVISKIFIDLNILETRFARIVLVTSTIQDVLLWSVLAIATGLAGSIPAEQIAVDGSTIQFMIMTVLKTVFFCVGGLLLGPIVLRIVRRLPAIDLIRSTRLGYALVWCFMVTALAAALDINVVFGALIAGIAFGQLQPGQLEIEKNQITEISMAFFVPIYFALVGYSIDLPNSFHANLFFSFLVFSTLVEGLCVFAAIKLLRFNTMCAFNFAVAMNTRGGPGIVLASITFSFGLIDARLFVALVLTAIVTSLLSGMWFNYLVRTGRPLMPGDSR